MVWMLWRKEGQLDPGILENIFNSISLPQHTIWRICRQNMCLLNLSLVKTSLIKRNYKVQITSSNSVLGAFEYRSAMAGCTFFHVALQKMNTDDSLISPSACTSFHPPCWESGSEHPEAWPVASKCRSGNGLMSGAFTETHKILGSAEEQVTWQGKASFKRWGQVGVQGWRGVLQVGPKKEGYFRPRREWLLWKPWLFPCELLPQMAPLCLVFSHCVSRSGPGWRFHCMTLVVLWAMAWKLVLFRDNFTIYLQSLVLGLI